MKNALIIGIAIGILSGLWLFAMHWLGYSTSDPHEIAPYEYYSVLIPIVCLYFGVRSYRENEMHGTINFLEALVQCFKALLLGGVIAIFASIIYINWIYQGTNLADFSGRLFGAMLVGVIEALAVALLLMNKSKAI